MNQKILVVEDNMIIAQDIVETLHEIGYPEIDKAASIEVAKQKLKSNTYDLVLLDIHLQEALDGITIARHIDLSYSIPYVFLTSYSDDLTLNKVKECSPRGYVLKPFTKETLKVNVQIALKSGASKLPNKSVENTELTIKNGYDYVKINVKDILMIESDKNYIHIYFQAKKITLRDTLKNFKTRLPECFEFSHKKYIINLQHVKQFNSSEIFIGNKTLPIGRNFQANLHQKLTQNTQY